LKFDIGVGTGERIAGNEFGENQTFKMVARGSFLMKKLQFLPW
jgi:hypothetical protein